MNINKAMKTVATYNGGQLPALAFPGFYPLYYITSCDEVICPDCVNGAKNDNEVVAHEINWEDPHRYCECCSNRIPSAYKEDEE